MKILSRLRLIGVNRPRFGLRLVFFRSLIGHFRVIPYIFREVSECDILIFDREERARDNGEYYFKHVLANYPRLGVFFAIDKNSHCGQRLAREGLGKYLVQPNSGLFWMHFKSSRVVASSQNVVDVQARSSKLFFGPNNKKKVVYLRHGVMHQGANEFLKFHDYDLICSSTNAEVLELERQSILFRGRKSKSIKLTGLARFDQFSKTQIMAKEKRILICPTWRPHSFKGIASKSKKRHHYLNEWSNLLSYLVTNSNRELIFLAHDLLDTNLSRIAMELNIRVVEFRDVEFSKLIESSELLVSDHSSIVFDSILSETPFIVFRFDQAAHSVGNDLNRYDVLQNLGWHICREASCVMEHVESDTELASIGEKVSKLKLKLFGDLPTSCNLAIDEELDLFNWA